MDPAKSGVTGGYADFHSHLVPTVDDGSRNLDDSLHSVGRMVAAGVDRIITTPHLRASVLTSSRFDPLMEYLDSRWRRVRDAVRATWPELDFRRGFEVRLDSPAPDLSDPRMRLGGTRFVLVEWAAFMARLGSPEMLSRLADSGYIPVLAHPERYHGIDRELRIVHAWKNAGAYLQANYGSLTGQYGPKPRALVRRFLEEGLVDYLSSDFHGQRGYTFYLDPGTAELRRLGGDAQLELLARVNPTRLFEGRRPLEVPPLTIDEPLTHSSGRWSDG
ncbi:MAG: hypothetical protein OXL34_14430 [Gemmatimonadota bacterium]|nr:hypothetical protein [Gemmatimonadota bacterium]